MQTKNFSVPHSTEDKYPLLLYFLKRACKRRPIYVDLYAGEGAYYDKNTGEFLSYGSPIQAFMYLNEKFSMFKMMMFETKNISKLSKAFSVFRHHAMLSKCELYKNCENFTDEHMKKIRSKKDGLIFIDPENSVLNWNLIKKVSSNNQLDVLVHVSKDWVRVYSEMAVRGHLEDINRKHGYILGPDFKKHGWTFFLLTDVPLKDDCQYSFVDIRSHEGKTKVLEYEHRKGKKNMKNTKTEKTVIIRLSEETKNEIKNYLTENYSISEISELFGIGQSTVSYYRKKFGITNNSNPTKGRRLSEEEKSIINNRFKKDHPVASIASDLGLSPTTIYKMKKKTKKNWDCGRRLSEETRKDINSYVLMTGFSNAELGKMFGVATSTIAYYRKKQKLLQVCSTSTETGIKETPRERMKKCRPTQEKKYTNVTTKVSLVELSKEFEKTKELEVRLQNLLKKTQELKTEFSERIKQLIDG